MTTMSSNRTGFRKGNRIETSGEGRTAKWPHGTGTVTASRRGYVYVVWDGTHFEDEMEPREINLAVDHSVKTGNCDCAPQCAKAAAGY